MECDISSLLQKEADSSIVHANEIACIKNEMRAEFQQEREQLIIQIRELNKMKQEADAEVNGLTQIGSLLHSCIFM